MSSRGHRNDYDDGRSGASSFYQAQGGDGSQDPFSSQPPSQRQRRRESQSTFFGRGGEEYAPQNLDYQSQYGSRGAGYNNESYSRHPDAIEPVKGGMDEEPGTAGWDVYADFNNAGPRYSTAFGNPLKPDDGYRPLSKPNTVGTRSKKGGTSTTYEPEVELVTVPAMGAEWTAQELKDMKKSGKAERKREERQREWRAFVRDQKGLCGIPWLTRKVIVWFTFGFLISLGLLLFFVIPRVPSFGFNFSTPLITSGGFTPYFNRVPANFSFPSTLDIQADTGGSFIPLHFKNISAEIYAAETAALVATGSTGSLTMKPKSLVPLAINMTFAYEGANTSDTTWNMYYLACRNKIAAVNATRPGLNIRLILKMDIVGLVGTYGASTLIRDTPCPIQLPVNAG